MRAPMHRYSLVALLVLIISPLAYSSPIAPLAFAETKIDTTLYLDSSWQNASTTYPGQQNAFYGILSTALPSTQALVSLVLQDESGQKIVNYTWDNVTFTQGKPTSIIYTLPRMNLTPGVYTWKVGLFTPGWKKQINWYDSPQTFAVITATSTGYSTSTTLLNGVWQLLDTMRSGNSNYFTASFSSGESRETVLVEIDLFDSNNRLITQKTWDYVTLNPRDSVTEVLSTPKLEVGTYHWGVGIFSPQRKKLLSWYDSPLTFTVNDGF